MKITVTQAHIDHAMTFRANQSKYRPSRHCPLACALRSCGKAGVVHFDEWDDGTAMRKLSPQAMAFVEQWDSGKKVSPATLEL